LPARYHLNVPAVRVVLGVVVAAALLASGCGDTYGDGDTGGGDAQLADTDWVLDADSLDVAVPAEAEVTLSFTDDAVSGNAGCNNFTGGYTATSDGELELSQLGSTQMACVDEVAAAETAVLLALEEVAAYEIDRDSLVLSDADGTELLRFAAEPSGS
jgi:heat shock protein HslJ